MAELAVILGSGFSYSAGLPLAKEINRYFLRDNSRKILKFGSGEFRWDDFADKAHKNNGRLSNDHLAYGIILNEFTKLFGAENEVFTNYEEFYQFVLDSKTNDEIIDQLKKGSILSFNEHFPHINENPYYDNYTHAIRNFQSREFMSLINHLIGDLLYVRKLNDEIQEVYKNVADYYEQYQSIDFMTLNHDLLLELIISDIMKKQFSDGFSFDQKVLKSSDGEPLKLFNGDFSGPISIIKLHGSIDTYRYVVAEEIGRFIQPTGEYLYFKTSDYYEKQRPERYNPETDEKLQTFHWEIDPFFITGTKKLELIEKDSMYATLFTESGNRLKTCKELLIIGYSFGDQHINEIIKNAISTSNTIESIINVNPLSTFPFEIKGIEAIQLKGISELI